MKDNIIYIKNVLHYNKDKLKCMYKLINICKKNRNKKIKEKGSIQSLKNYQKIIKQQYKRNKDTKKLKHKLKHVSRKDKK